MGAQRPHRRSRRRATPLPLDGAVPSVVRRGPAGPRTPPPARGERAAGRDPGTDLLVRIHGHEPAAAPAPARPPGGPGEPPQGVASGRHPTVLRTLLPHDALIVGPQPCG